MTANFDRLPLKQDRSPLVLSNRSMNRPGSNPLRMGSKPSSELA